MGSSETHFGGAWERPKGTNCPVVRSRVLPAQCCLQQCQEMLSGDGHDARGTSLCIYCLVGSAVHNPALNLQTPPGSAASHAWQQDMEVLWSHSTEAGFHFVEALWGLAGPQQGDTALRVSS